MGWLTLVFVKGELKSHSIVCLSFKVFDNDIPKLIVFNTMGIGYITPEEKKKQRLKRDNYNFTFMTYFVGICKDFIEN